MHVLLENRLNVVKFLDGSLLKIAPEQNFGFPQVLKLNQARLVDWPDPVNQPVRTACTIVHHYNGTQYCSTESILLIFPFPQTNNITSHSA